MNRHKGRPFLDPEAFFHVGEELHGGIHAHNADLIWDPRVWRLLVSSRGPHAGRDRQDHVVDREVTMVARRPVFLSGH